MKIIIFLGLFFVGSFVYLFYVFPRSLILVPFYIYKKGFLNGLYYPTRELQTWVRAIRFGYFCLDRSPEEIKAAMEELEKQLKEEKEIEEEYYDKN